MSALQTQSLVKTSLGTFEVMMNNGRVYLWVANDHHHICVCCEHIDESCKITVAHLHALKLCHALPTAQFELLDDIADFFKTVNIAVKFPCRMRNHKKSGMLEQDYFVCVADITQILEVAFKDLHVGYQGVHDSAPCLVQGFVPN